MNGLPRGVPDLSGAGMVQIRGYSVFHVAGVDVLAAQIPGLQGEVTLRIVDIVNSVAYLTPMTLANTERLAEQMQEAVNAIRHEQRTKGE